jgi:amino-acid N-acetyltransferase
VAEDLESVRALVAACGLPVAGLADQFATGFVVAHRAGRLVGCAGLEAYGAYGLLRSVAVDTALRGTGLGVALTWDRIIEARRRGLRSLWLLTTTAAAFFPRLGFQRVDRVDAPPDIQASPEFATVCPSTAVCMQLPLG